MDMPEPMSELRDDIDPEIVMEDAINCLKEFFQTEEEIVEYINGFEEPEDAELCLETYFYYYFPKCKDLPSYVKYFMFIAVLEKVSNHDYKPFKDWVMSKKKPVKDEIKNIEEIDYESFKELMKKLKERYHNSHGSRRSFMGFLRDNLKKEEKIDLIRSFATEWKEDVPIPPKFAKKYETIEECAEEEGLRITEERVPHCFEWDRCYAKAPGCDPRYNCKLRQDKKKLREVFDEISKTLYGYRCDFGHGAGLKIPFTFGGKEMRGSVDYNDSKIDTMEDFEEIIDKALERYFNKKRNDDG